MARWQGMQVECRRVLCRPRVPCRGAGGRLQQRAAWVGSASMGQGQTDFGPGPSLVLLGEAACGGGGVPQPRARQLPLQLIMLRQQPVMGDKGQGGRVGGSSGAAEAKGGAGAGGPLQRRCHQAALCSLRTCRTRFPGLRASARQRRGERQSAGHQAGGAAAFRTPGCSCSPKPGTPAQQPQPTLGLGLQRGHVALRRRVLVLHLPAPGLCWTKSAAAKKGALLPPGDWLPWAARCWTSGPA